MKKLKLFAIQSFFVFILAFLLNFFWESWHAVLFYEDHATYKSLFFVKMITYASFMDALLILLIFVIGCLLWKDFNWMKKYKMKKVLFTAVLGVIIAVIIEAKALYFKQWAYNEIMPTIFGMGLSPLVQLSITGVITLFIASKMFYEK
ncbi:hypothetical protein HZA97_02850 [Candidatus Woesearchaeota archaeon]|nr:hypothetical protein [Candidatus Woesearchaeota archaeon]